jgi:hypothetical protein
VETSSCVLLAYLLGLGGFVVGTGGLFCVGGKLLALLFLTLPKVLFPVLVLFEFVLVAIFIPL